ncbi:hypothetical protein [Clostridium sp. Marseille-P299]|uniref:hypothetical protein n=1 Tax=Clostridium sp. Marseille-P299 TaxID=1805477 RepID=UPI000831DFFB|nr:hypothetical protein [Clostridium sp. Marseille-P299]
MRLQKMLPLFGKIAIVDNNYEEVVTLTELLASEGAPYIFYDYERSIITDKIRKLNDIRLVFLDIRLDEGVQDETTICSTLASTVEKIVPTKNGPYSIVLWTNEIALKDKVSEYLLKMLSEDETTLPMYVCGIDKKDFLSNPIERLEETLFEELKPQYMVNFLMRWENESMKSSGELVRKLIRYQNKLVDNNTMEKILAQIAFLENSELRRGEEATQSVLNILGELFVSQYYELVNSKELLDEMKMFWKLDFSKEDQVSTIRQGINIQTRARFNTLMNVNLSGNKEDHLPGKFYFIQDSDVLLNIATLHENTFKKKLEIDMMNFGESKVEYKMRPIEIDITPQCDYAQNKNHMLRMAYGYMISFEKVKDIKSNKDIWLDVGYTKKIKDKTGYNHVYVTPELYIDDKICVLIFNTKYVTIEHKKFHETHEYIARLNSDILNEIRKNSAESISRIGINNL